jgi:Fur family zinc uptake transcriptional regulator
MQAVLPMFPAPAHDHAACVQAILVAGERVCAAHGARLTAGRRRVLEIVASRHGAMGAYQIIDSLAGSGRRPAPMTVYRALEFLIEHGLVHRLASRNAFVACRHPGRMHAAQFLMCRGCGVVGEISDDGLVAAVVARAEGEGFAAQTPLIEIEGLCRQCERSPCGNAPPPLPPRASRR